MKVTVFRNSSPSGTKRYSFRTKLEMADSVSTNVVARPMPMAVSSFLETPMNGHNPRKRTSTMLFTRIVLTRRSRYSDIYAPQNTAALLKAETRSSLEILHLAFDIDPFVRLRQRFKRRIDARPQLGELGIERDTGLLIRRYV